MFALIDYVFETDNLNYVDKSRIGATGHSGEEMQLLEEPLILQRSVRDG